MPRRKTLDKQKSDKNNLFPSHPSVTLINGQIAFGKTTLLLNMLFDKNIYYQKFNRILLFSPCFSLDKKQMSILGSQLLVTNKKLINRLQDEEDEIILDDGQEPPEREPLPDYSEITPDMIYETYSADILKNLVDYQEFIIKEYGKEYSDKCLIILEDAISLGVFRLALSNYFSKILTRIRHLNCSVVMLTQLYMSVPKVIRNNITNLISFATNDREKQEIYEEFSCQKSKSEFDELFTVITRKQHDFIHINKQNQPNFNVIHNFDRYVA